MDAYEYITLEIEADGSVSLTGPYLIMAPTLVDAQLIAQRESHLPDGAPLAVQVRKFIS